MDFFEHQSEAKTSSLTLLVFFALVVTVLFFVVAFSVSIINNILSFERDFLALTPTGLFVAGMFWFAIAAGCFFRWLDVRGGGSCLAKRFGAHPVDELSRDNAERQLPAITAEMAIAAGVVTPSIWIMPFENSINAFVVGGGDDVAIVVTRAAIDNLDREQMQALIGHEMGHVVQGDLAINMRMLIALSGLMALTEIGDMLGDNIGGRIFHAVGSICVFCGSMVRAAFSRRREFLADATSVQFTRNPGAMASCLYSVKVQNVNRTLRSPFRHELSHLCFSVKSKNSWLARKLSTHPPIDARITRIDPNHNLIEEVRSRKAANDAQIASANEQTIAQTANPLNAHPLAALAGLAGISGLVGSGATASAEKHRVTAPPIGSVKAFQQKIDQETSDSLSLMMSRPEEALVGMFALFVSKEPEARRAYLNSLAFAYRKPFADKVEKLYDYCGEILQSNPLPVIDHLAGVLCAHIDVEKRRAALKQLETLVAIESEATLVNLTCLKLLRLRLKVEHCMLESTPVEQTTLSQCEDSSFEATASSVAKSTASSKDIALLLSLLLEASGNSTERNREEFDRVIGIYTAEPERFRSSSEEGIATEMEAAFDKMIAQPKMSRDTFLQHCCEVVVADHEVTHAENLLLSLFAASLDVDMPDYHPATNRGTSWETDFRKAG